LLNIPMNVSKNILGDYSVMVSEAKGRLFRRKDGKYLLYIPKGLAEDSMFPFKPNPEVIVKISFKIRDKKLTIEKWKEETDT
jgi:hypothetical protein